MRIAQARLESGATPGEVDSKRFYPLVGDIYSPPVRSGESVPLSAISLESPTQPRNLLVMLGGFVPKDGSPLPPGSVPKLTPKLCSPVLGDSSEVVIPSWVSGPVWAEVEMAIVIGRRIQQAASDQALDAILGYTCFNDFSASEFVPSDFLRAKSIDTFASMGPWIRTDLTEQDIQGGLRLLTRVNGVTQAEGTTAKLKFPPSQVVSFVSQFMTLLPGDVISLGTPSACDVVAGDEVEIEIEGIGTLKNRMVAA